MKIVKAIWPFVGLILIMSFMSAFKYSDELSSDEKAKISAEIEKVHQQDNATGGK
ncbi:hypothetical protein OZL92_08395 [Bacillus sonorensis]|uniref:Capsule synthesis protein CapE n=2 Tax=Bacillus sonorensis TaxID=119858 RepID=M5PD24_9BACI|nr:MULTISPECIES: hypothetical protein [Bacillus]TWK80596.1 hypothetical protein CHCC20335_0550 [Bacillus paralicheniformis]ASB87117.1 uncharacterized protein S101395_00562 [Bacillus sonorensis]EME73402.1 capsule synthesis protein CapE [Bacillus sonorensis L12]MCF7616365.1 hypothetical protein [Bacillus sonorensis]MCY7857709.1 hypothetical protein [Bacillus sonorensis]